MKPTKQQMLISQLMTKPDSNIEIFKRLKIITYMNGSPIVAIFSKGARPVAHYRFQLECERQKFIDDQKQAEVKAIEQHQEEMEKYKQKAEKYKAGSVLYSSWGYEQTNIDWFIVLERKNMFVTVQQIGSKRTFDNGFNDRGSCMPDQSVKIGEPFRKKIDKYACINLNSYTWCGLWDGQPKSWSSYA